MPETGRAGQFTGVERGKVTVRNAATAAIKSRWQPVAGRSLAIRRA
jgi:hypothetical protein